MDQLFGEIHEKAQAMGLGNIQPGANTSFNPYAADDSQPAMNDPNYKPSSQYTDAELMEIY